MPSLDDSVESLLIKKYGQKGAFGNSPGLYTKSLRAVEKLGYQGQVASRMAIVSNCYTQKALGCLLDTLQEKEVNMERAIQTVRDIFVMSTKTLDQICRAGAYHHIIRRKATMFDTGLSDYKDYSSTILSLPLSGDGVFGNQFDDKLEAKTERNKQLAEVLPDFNKSKTANNRGTSFQQTNFKRKNFTYYSEHQPKRQRNTSTDYSGGSGNRYS